MLSQLHVENYVLIDSLDIPFPEGLVIISGQTGSGKSILLGALALALGAKADAGAVGAGAENCIVEAEFSVAGDASVAEILRENDLEAPGGVLTIRRVLGRSGRSRSFVNDEPVALGVLQALSGRLVDIHSQHQTLRLQDPSFRLALLDHFAGCSEQAEACRASWQRLQELRRRLAETTEQLSRLSAEKAYNEAQFQTLSEARIREGEIEELEQEQHTLAHAEEIKALLVGIQEELDPSDGREGGGNLRLALKEAVRALGKAARHIPSLASLEERLESARVEIDDILDEVASAEARTAVSPARLAEVEERLSLLYGLLQKYGVRTESELLERQEAFSRSLGDASALEEEEASLQAEITAEKGRYDNLASALHGAREAAAERFAREVEASLRFLELERAVFSVVLEPHPEGPAGTDSVQFLFSAGGAAPRELAKVASGGELSRIMLSLKAMMARFTAMPTLIFDEIDTGVSGSAADKMGSLICRMGADMQVFAITHQPQVAAKGDAHYLVTKTGDRTAIRRLDRPGRIQELARMLSGSVVTPAAMANAESLLNG